MAHEIFIRINKLLYDSGHNPQINGLSDLEAFLRDPENKKLQVYDEVEELYDVIMLGSGMW